MNEEELLELRKLLIEASENNDWSVIVDAVDFIDEFIDTSEDTEEL